ncbi:MAG: hypothetical protein M1510_10985 [Nitrospirae bacterium]|nr:hypothetical protein [Nitrospirota bacterium]MCL5238788.1 hypothetical protein [Nitrospirota bacterium]
MEACYKCGGRADYICRECGTKMCKAHMELRYTGPHRGFKSRYMCPKCWKKKQVVLNENMVKVDEYKPKTYIWGK